MVKKLWTRRHLDELSIAGDERNVPIEVLYYIKQVIQILDKFYGVGRPVNADGGFVLLLLPDTGNEEEMIPKLLKEYNMSIDEAEFCDVIVVDEEKNRKWYGTHYVLGTEYNLVVVYSIVGEGLSYGILSYRNDVGSSVD